MYLVARPPVHSSISLYGCGQSQGTTPFHIEALANQGVTALVALVFLVFQGWRFFFFFPLPVMTDSFSCTPRHW